MLKKPQGTQDICADPPRTHADSYVIVNLRGCGRDVLAWPTIVFWGIASSGPD